MRRFDLATRILSRIGFSEATPNPCASHQTTDPQRLSSARQIEPTFEQIGAQLFHFLCGARNTLHGGHMAQLSTMDPTTRAGACARVDSIGGSAKRPCEDA